MINESDSLNHLLKSNYCEKDDLFYNFVNMTQPRGTFLLGTKNLDKLFNLLPHCINQHGLAEKSQTHIPLYFDFDKKVKIGEPYSHGDREKIVIKMSNILYEKFGIKTSFLVLEKDDYENRGFMKCGFHIHDPTIFIKKEIMINHIIPVLEKDFSPELCYDYILDNVYNNPWLVYGAVKDLNLEPYLLTKFYKDEKLHDISELENFSQFEIFDTQENKINVTRENFESLLPRILSIHCSNRKITEIDGKYLRKNVDNPIEKVEKEKLRTREKTLSDDDIYKNREKIRKLLPLINTNIDSTRNLWFSIGATCASETNYDEETFEIFDEWCQNFDSYNRDENIKMWNNTELNGSIGILVNKAKIDNPEKYKELMNKPIIVLIDDEKLDDNYIWTDFLNDSNNVFESYDKLVAFFVKNFPRVCARINYGSGMYIKKETLDDRNNIVRDVKIIYDYLDEKGKKRFTFLSSLILDTKMQTYSKIVCKPSGIIGKHEYNIWSPLISDKPIDKIDTVNLPKLLDYIKDIICNGNDIINKWFLCWLRQICLFPYKKTKVFVLLKSVKQQVGKGNLINFLIKYLFGEHCSCSVNGLDKILGKHNTILQNKVFIGINEIPTADKQFYKSFDILKSMITDDKQEIEPKGIDTYVIDSYVNFIGCTNHQKPIHLEQGDARYCIIDVNESKRGDFDYFNKMNDEVFTEEIGKQFFNYLKNLPKEKLVEIRNIPMTEAKSKIMTNSMNSLELFVKQIRERYPIKMFIDGIETKNEYGNITETCITTIPIDKNIKVTKKNLNNSYVSWCMENREIPMKQKYFNDVIPEVRGTNGYRFHIIYPFK